jgi:hypothetical protein
MMVQMSSVSPPSAVTDDEISLCRFFVMSRLSLISYSIVAAAGLLAACGHQQPLPSGASATTNAAAAQGDSLVLAGKAFSLHAVRCMVMGSAVLVTGKTDAGEDVIVDAAAGKLEALNFTADGVTYFWEPTSTGGAPTPVFGQNGKTYTVTGKIKQLHDSTKFSDFNFRATCPK